LQNHPGVNYPHPVAGVRVKEVNTSNKLYVLKVDLCDDMSEF